MENVAERTVEPQECAVRNARFEGKDRKKMNDRNKRGTPHRKVATTTCWMCQRRAMPIGVDAQRAALCDDHFLERVHSLMVGHGPAKSHVMV